MKWKSVPPSNKHTLPKTNLNPILQKVCLIIDSDFKIVTMQDIFALFLRVENVYSIGNNLFLHINKKYLSLKTRKLCTQFLLLKFNRRYKFIIRYDPHILETQLNFAINLWKLSTKLIYFHEDILIETYWWEPELIFQNNCSCQ